METIAILRLIIARSPDASREALAAIRAIEANSPMTQHRLNRVAELALSDRDAEWTPAERQQIATLIDMTGVAAGNRSRSLPIRLTEAEYDDLQQLADSAGMSMAEYIRRAVFR